jgi:hypothetical protein
MRPTAIVLWLMILLVFVPIGAAHGIALLMERGENAELAAVRPAPGGKPVLTR